MASDDGLSQAMAAINGCLPANNAVAIQILNRVIAVLEVVHGMIPQDQKTTLDIVGKMLLTVENGSDLDDLYGLLDRLRAARHAKK